MDIFGHLIKDQEIIGLSPLYSEPSKSDTAVALYGSFRYVFYIHCRQQSIKIQSDFFYPKQNNQVLDDDDKKKRNQWWDDYHKAKQMIADEIGELIHEKN